jgi:quercetin dioxygenase-like cupin family protein
MPSYRIFETQTVAGRRKPVALELGAQAVRMNQFDSTPGQTGVEHDESESGQEEVYVALGGSGTLCVDGDEVELVEGRYVLVQPEAVRQVVAGPEGLSYLVVGAAV